MVATRHLIIDLFHILFERSVTRNSFKMLADVCSCSPESLYSSSVQDRHYQSWSAICKVRRKIWKVVWRKGCDTKYAFSLPLKGTCHWLWTSTCILVFQLWTFQWNSWCNAGEWKVCGDRTNAQTYGWTVCWDEKFPSEFQEHFLPFFARHESHDLSENLVVENVTKLFNSAYCLNFQTHSSILHWIQMGWGYFLTVTRHCT